MRPNIRTRICRASFRATSTRLAQATSVPTRCACCIGCARPASTPTWSAAPCATCCSAAIPRTSTSPPTRRRKQVKAAVPQLPPDRSPLPPGARGVRPRDHRGRDLPRQRRRRQRRSRAARRRPRRCATTSTARSRTTRSAATSPPTRCTTRSRISRCATTSAASRTCENRCMRLIGDPETRYREDPVRMLRAVRLAAKLDFEIESATAAADPAACAAAARSRAGATVRGMPEAVPRPATRWRASSAWNATACSARCCPKPRRR